MGLNDALLNNWFQVIYDGNNIDITDIDGFALDTIEPIEIEGESQTEIVDGIDGSVFKNATFKPFTIVANFIYQASDKEDFALFNQHLNSFLNMRKPYYIRHSKMKGMKYQVSPTPKIKYENKGNVYYYITIEFECLKGYAETADYPMNSRSFNVPYESVYNIFNSQIQFGQNFNVDRTPVYNHEAKRFLIFNGSTDPIDPSYHHELVIKINIEAPNGFKMTNKTTGDVFEYKNPLKSNETLKIIGVIPFLDDIQVGNNTNHNWITLDVGDNDIKIEGVDIGIPKTEWKFNFIFR